MNLKASDDRSGGVGLPCRRRHRVAVAVCVHAGRSEADRSVRNRGETTGLRAWLLRTGVIKPEIGPEIQRAYRGLAQSDEFDGGCPPNPRQDTARRSPS